jgi:predicted transposase YdaD
LGIVELILEPQETAADKAKQLLSMAQQTRQLPIEVIMELIETTMVYKFPQLSRQEIVEMLELATESKQTRVYQEGLEEGIRRGREDGIQRGLAVGERSLILLLLTRKLGEINPEIRSRIESLSLQQLEALAEAFLDFSTLEDLMNWLNINQH